MTLSLEDDLSSLETLKIKDYEGKYDLTTERHQALRALLGRHMTHLLESKALFENQKKKNEGDRFELIEIDENEMKNEMH